MNYIYTTYIGRDTNSFWTPLSVWNATYPFSRCLASQGTFLCIYGQIRLFATTKKSSEIDSFCLSLIECVPTQSLAQCDVRFLILSVHNHIFSFHIKFNISYKQYRLKFSQVLFLKAGMNYKICYREILDIPLDDLIAGK